MCDVWLTSKVGVERLRVLVYLRLSAGEDVERQRIPLNPLARLATWRNKQPRGDAEQPELVLVQECLPRNRQSQKVEVG